MTEPHKQVSEEPLTPPQPRRGRSLLTFFLLGSLVAVVTGTTLYWIDPLARRDSGHVTQWPNPSEHPPLEPYTTHYDLGVEKMQMVAEALVAYRDGPFGGGLRWPMSLEELTATGLLEPDFDFTGMLSGRPIVYQPEAPIAQDPDLWVICHDAEVSLRRTRTGLRAQVPVAAVVILGDGTVKLLEAEELSQYAGLSSIQDGPR